MSYLNNGTKSDNPPLNGHNTESDKSWEREGTSETLPRRTTRWLS